MRAGIGADGGSRDVLAGSSGDRRRERLSPCAVRVTRRSDLSVSSILRPALVGALPALAMLAVIAVADLALDGWVVVAVIAFALAGLSPKLAGLFAGGTRCSPARRAERPSSAPMRAGSTRSTPGSAR